MNRNSFAVWLQKKKTYTQALHLNLYEKRDKLLYIDRPALERRYMEEVGDYEQLVLEAEFACELQQKKKQMVQTAINRREPIDEAAIDAELEAYRRSVLQKAQESTPPEGPQLSEEETEELQELYRALVQRFHPQMHPDLTELQQTLYQQAMEAYRNRNLPAMRLVYDLLNSETTVAVAAMRESVRVSDAIEASAEGFARDHRLAAEIYASFLPTQEEAAIEEATAQSLSAIEEITDEITRIRGEFPFTAAEMLDDPAQKAAYMKELEKRMENAKQEEARLRQEIRNMIEGVVRHE